ncbi:MAG: hypothetical protein R3C56_35620 [Pirellulaceae bacterium]
MSVAQASPKRHYVDSSAQQLAIYPEVIAMKLRDFAIEHVGRQQIGSASRLAYGQSVQWACRYFGADRELATITNSDFR